MLEIGARSGMTAAKLKKELLHGLEASADAGALPRAYPRPAWRVPADEDINSVMNGLRRGSRLHADAFVAVNLFARKNPSRVFGHRPLSFNSAGPVFSIGIKSRWTIQNLIRWNGRTVHMDSSWRNKNENRAPLTFVTTVNAAGHMVPCAAYLSATATAQNYAYLLKALRAEVLAEATRVCDAAAASQGRSDSGPAHSRLLAEATKIKAAGTWTPSVVMIDKCKASLKALRTVWPEAQVRICQFHIVQAILRWDTDNRSKNDRPPGISISDKQRLCRAFRRAQRCRLKKEWPSFLTAFESKVHGILSTYKAGTADSVLEYFRTNWWAEEWLPLVTDIGFGSGQSRDDINTNNTIERAFKTFDDIFLACRVNKRIDRLVHILSVDWINYYEHYTSDVPRVSSTIKEMMLSGHKLWEIDAVRGADEESGANQTSATQWTRLRAELDDRAVDRTTDSTYDKASSGVLNDHGDDSGSDEEDAASVESTGVDEGKIDLRLGQTSPGRPAKPAPLQPGRSAVRFSKKRGRDKCIASSTAKKTRLAGAVAEDEISELIQAMPIATPTAPDPLSILIERTSRDRAITLLVGKSATKHLLFQDDFAGLRVGGWLSWTVISLYLQLLKDEIGLDADVAPQLERVFLGASWLYQHCCKKVEIKRKAASYLPELALLAWDTVVYPVNIKNTHWAVVIVDYKRSNITYGIPSDFKFQT
ncbi:hypothetical protein OC844_006942 [Tilletia horrida]|nr:hypothetical protein OC844_006942 [Tilletia horrida]